MINKILLVVVGVFTITFFALGLGTTASAINLFGKTCNGNGTTTGGDSTQKSDVCTNNNNHLGDTAGKNAALDTINAAANIVASLAGLLAVIMIIVGGFKFVTTGGLPGGQRAGDASGVKSARAQIINASIGLVIIAMAWTITRFITYKLL